MKLPPCRAGLRQGTFCPCRKYPKTRLRGGRRFEAAQGRSLSQDGRPLRIPGSKGPPPAACPHPFRRMRPSNACPPHWPLSRFRFSNTSRRRTSHPAPPRSYAGRPEALKGEPPPRSFGTGRPLWAGKQSEPNSSTAIAGLDYWRSGRGAGIPKGLCPLGALFGHFLSRERK